MSGQNRRAQRYIGLAADAPAILARQKSLPRPQYVFVRSGDRVDKSLWYRAPLSRHTLSEQFTKRSRLMGRPWDAVLHSTRHTALTDFGAAGADAFTIQQIAGHASVTTSQRVCIRRGDDSVGASCLERYRKAEAAAQPPGLAIVAKMDEHATESATLQLAQAGSCKRLVIEVRKWRNWQTHQT